MYIYACVYMYTCIYMYMCIYIHIYVHIQKSLIKIGFFVRKYFSKGIYRFREPTNCYRVVRSETIRCFYWDVHSATK